MTVQVRVSDGRGGSDTEQVLATPGNSAPTITGAVTPSPSLTWAVGQTVGFSATATDDQQTLPDSAYTWSIAIEHCPSVCHTHGLQTFPQQRTGNFPAPDHEYPSDLLLTVTVTDDQGLTDSATVQIDPKSVAMTFASSPSGAALTVAGNGVFAPHSQTFIQGTNFNVSTPETRTFNGADYTFSSWSDGGARTHPVVAPATATTLTATYTRDVGGPDQPPRRRQVTFLTRPGELKVKVDGKPRTDGWHHRFDVGRAVKVTAPKRQWHDGVLYEFVRWSDGGTRIHSVLVPDLRLRIRAVYRRV